MPFHRFRSTPRTFLGAEVSILVMFKPRPTDKELPAPVAYTAIRVCTWRICSRPGLVTLGLSVKKSGFQDDQVPVFIPLLVNFWLMSLPYPWCHNALDSRIYSPVIMGRVEAHRIGIDSCVPLMIDHNPAHFPLVAPDCPRIIDNTSNSAFALTSSRSTRILSLNTSVAA